MPNRFSTRQTDSGSNTPAKKYVPPKSTYVPPSSAYTQTRYEQYQLAQAQAQRDAEMAARVAQANAYAAALAKNDQMIAAQRLAQEAAAKQAAAEQARANELRTSANKNYGTTNPYATGQKAIPGMAGWKVPERDYGVDERLDFLRRKPEPTPPPSPAGHGKMMATLPPNLYEKGLLPIPGTAGWKVPQKPLPNEPKKSVWDEIVEWKNDTIKDNKKSWDALVKWNDKRIEDNSWVRDNWPELKEPLKNKFDETFAYLSKPYNTEKPEKVDLERSIQGNVPSWYSWNKNPGEYDELTGKPLRKVADKTPEFWRSAKGDDMDFTLYDDPKAAVAAAEAAFQNMNDVYAPAFKEKSEDFNFNLFNYGINPYSLLNPYSGIAGKNLTKEDPTAGLPLLDPSAALTQRYLGYVNSKTGMNKLPEPDNYAEVYQQQLESKAKQYEPIIAEKEHQAAIDKLLASNPDQNDFDRAELLGVSVSNYLKYVWDADNPKTSLSRDTLLVVGKDPNTGEVMFLPLERGWITEPTADVAPENPEVALDGGGYGEGGGWNFGGGGGGYNDHSGSAYNGYYDNQNGNREYDYFSQLAKWVI